MFSSICPMFCLQDLFDATDSLSIFADCPMKNCQCCFENSVIGIYLYSFVADCYFRFLLRHENWYCFYRSFLGVSPGGVILRLHCADCYPIAMILLNYQRSFVCCVKGTSVWRWALSSFLLAYLLDVSLMKACAQKLLQTDSLLGLERCSFLILSINWEISSIWATSLCVHLSVWKMWCSQ